MTLKRSRVVQLVTVSLILMFAMTINTDSSFAEEKNIGTIEKPEPIKIDNKEYARGQAIVMFKTPTKVSKKKTMRILNLDENSFTIEDQWTFRTSKQLTTTSKGNRKLTPAAKSGYEAVALVKSKKYTTNQLIKILKSRDDVKYAEPNYKVSARSITNDTYVDHQWSLQDGDNTPNISSIWSKATGSENIVAILDTGVDYGHPDIKDNMWENDNYPVLKGDFGYDFINGDDDPMDDNGHGTHCAGIIGAAGNNGEGISGVNQQIKIMALKTLNDEGSAYLSHEIEAYNYIDIALDLGEPVKAINNSWGGGDYSDIFAELIDIVGEKGAVTVCAAGNEGSNNDIESDYPSNIDSPYLISVAATSRDGQVAEYSNYGDEMVDVAAPGSEILSTVPYNSYNPTIYGDKQGDFSESFNDFQGSGDLGIPDNADPEKGKIYLNGELYDPAAADQAEVNVAIDTDWGFEDDSSMSIDIKGMKEDDLVALTIPFDIKEDGKVAPSFSVMAVASGPEGATGMFGGSILGILELPASIKPDMDVVGDQPLVGRFIEGESNTWDHFEMLCSGMTDETWDVADPEKRQAVIIVYANKAGDYRVNIDDIGISRQDLEDDTVFGKYDYMSGTSMAAPYVSGAIALKAAELGEDDAESIINNTVSMAKSTPELKVNQRGSIDFARALDKTKLPPRVGKIAVDKAKDTLIINGSGLAPEGGVKIEVGPNDEELTEAKIVGTPTDRSVTIKNEGWINNIETVKVTGYDNKESIRRDVYMVKGKKSLSIIDDMLESPSEATATDGRNIYWTDSNTNNIFKMQFVGNNGYSEPICNVDPGSLFTRGGKKTGTYGMLFGKDLIWTGGRLYTVVEYGLTQTPDGEDTEWMEVYKKGTAAYEGEFLTGENIEGPSTVYSGEMRLIGTYVNEDGETLVSNLGALPADLRQTEDWTMASYGGKIYFIGGYSHARGAKGISNKVKVYDPKSKKWSDGPSLPEGRAGGKAIQSGNDLIYTLGYSEAQEGSDVDTQSYPANMIFNGKTWKKSAPSKISAIEPHVVTQTVTRGGKTYLSSQGSIGLTRNGIVYMGLPAMDLGDIFKYDSTKDAFDDTGYNFINNILSEEMTGIVVGGTLYGFREGEVYRMPMPSGLLKVKVSKAKGGSVSGAGSYMPGETATSRVRAAKNFKIKTLKVNGKNIKLNKNQTARNINFANISEDKSVAAIFQKYKAVVKVKKKGKGKVTGGKTYLIGKKATIKVKAAKGYYIKSIKVDKKKIKVKKNAAKKTFKFKVKKDCAVKVVFKKKKK